MTVGYCATKTMIILKTKLNKIASQRRTHDTWRFLYLRETKSWCVEKKEKKKKKENMNENKSVC